jgi:hypothetical protein
MSGLALAAAHANDRVAYTRGKIEFFRVTEQARRFYGKGEPG